MEIEKSHDKLKGTVLYQLIADGDMACGQHHKYSSKNVFLEFPTDKQQKEFMVKCSGSSLYDLVLNTIEIRVVELTID